MKTDKKRILVVDDDTEVCEELCGYFRKNGFYASTAANGQEAMELLKDGDADVIILDVNMPIMDGFEFLKRVKSSPRYSRIPVIMLTAKAEPKNVEKGIELKADFYLPKPFTTDNLMEFVNFVT